MEVVEDKTDIQTGAVEKGDSSSTSRNLDDLPEIERVPDGWELDTIEGVAEDVLGGGTPSKSNEDYWGGEIPWASVKDLDGVAIQGTEDYITEEGVENSATNLISSGSVVISTRMTVGEAFMNLVDMAINQDLKAIKPDDSRVNTRFLVYVLRGKDRYLKSLGRGTTVSGITTADLKRTHFARPPLPEQRKIASVLYAVDQAIQKTEAIIEQAKRVKRGLIRSLLKKGIRPDGKIRDLDCEPESFQKTRLGTIPERWSIAQFKEAATLRHGFQFRSYHFSEAGYPVVKIKNVTDDGTLDMSDASRIPKSEADQFEDVELFEGDLLMSLTGNIGRVVEVPKTNVRLFQNYRVGRFTSQDQKKLSSGFLKLVLSSDLFYKQLMRQSSKTAQSNIGKKDFQRTLLPIPPLEEQNRISEKVEAHLEYIQQEKSNVDRLRRLKKGLMQDLLTGEVRTMDKAIEVLGEVKAHG
ncbi:type I restriction enzyme S subunit [Salinibacter ruber]|uniref:restriction endonuclease subunit S n=1 Tax=Salinibacter ruber TaxID=146919 RepID=UPI002167C53D|nr:restriction endonuclease subunit S [Salinibacter ruber]MCS3664397.1 type I restriction enzyme S subunit [Salinibacter ruber]